MPTPVVKNMTRGNFGKLLYPGLSKIFFKSYAKPASEYNKVFKIESHDEYFMRQGRMMGLGPFRHKAESSFIQMDAGKWLSEKEIYFPTYALGFGTSFELIEDDMYAQISKFTADLGDSANTTKELLTWDTINTGDSSASRVGLDGQPLFSDSHLTGDGVTTMDNLSSEALSQVALEGALTYFEKIVNERSEPTPFQGPKLLLIPPELKWKAKELLLSEYKPEFNVEPSSQYTDTRNAVNVVGDEDIQYRIIHWLAKPDMWILVDRNNHDLLGVNRRAVSFDQTVDPKSTDHIYYATFRYVSDFFDFRGAIAYMGA